jgi:23S rRNA pseudouridine2605 synthase
MRIQKYLSQKRVLSRRETEEYILQGRIMVNGAVIRDLGHAIDPEVDEVEVRSPRKKVSRKKTYAIYKPRGYTSSKSESEGKTVFDLFPKLSELNTVGRLDKASEGLLLLSDDGVVTTVVTGSGSVEKEYEVTVSERMTGTKITALRQGMMLDGVKTKPAGVKRINDHTFHITLTEGMHHQIRRMASHINLSVLRLKRFRIGSLTLKNLKLTEGTSTLVSEEDIDKFKNM